MTDLTEILARVEAATGPSYDLEEQIAQALEPERLTHFRTPPNYTVSLDSALALVERVLPDAYRDLGEGFDTKAQRRFWHATLTYHDSPGSHWAEAPTPALALLAAMLRALAAKET